LIQASVEQLRNKFFELQKEIEMQRQKLRSTTMGGSGGLSHSGDHLSSLVETQYEELSMAKKQLIEYEARETASQQRWNSMLGVR
jgi:hypothetical protein